MTTKYELTIFCKNIRYLRKMNKLSRREFSKILGISIITLFFIEKDIVPKWLSSCILINIYYNFGIKPSEMFIEPNTEQQ